jgi:hypothetical protein
MQERFGTKPQEVIVCVGPAIKACCFSSEETSFKKQFTDLWNDEEKYIYYEKENSKRFHIDLSYVIKKDCHLTGGTIDIHKVIAGCTRTKIGGMPNFADNIMQTNNTTTSIPEIDAPANPPSVWQVKITPTGSLEVLNGGIVIINYLSMEDGGELYIH